ncbi:MAG: hypothetical protein K8S18_08735 [Desulfobacula sp.]|nr:hypothetical protein [Desulfobacula sp.]
MIDFIISYWHGYSELSLFTSRSWLMKKLMRLMIGILISIGWIGYGYTAELF